ncbi:metallophosphoesterase [Roseateles sp. NT4]|uniref:metallophosphoesterase n=1 Tax=Roseateles sp. NT4 TaxID=3453715 RepID=UPI003EF07647
MRRFGLLIALVLLAGCASRVKDPVSMDRLDSWSPAASQPLTAEISLISDTQFHESRGYPSPILQGAGDEIVEVTIRSAQQVIGADDLLQRAIDMSGKSLLLHAGDALDMSCSSEWDRFARVMKSKGAPGPKTWVYTPGNHDGYLAGNLSTPPEGTHFRPFKDAHWAKLCNAGMLNPPRTTPFHKTDVVRAYLDLLGPGSDAGKDVRCNADASHCWAAHLSEDEPWESFIVQLVQMPAPDEAAKDATPVYALLLDSSNYRDLFGNESISSAGKVGGLLKGQFAAARRLTGRMKPDARFFFIAHYPIGNWRLNNAEQRAWKLLADDPRSLNFIVTSHTHDGELAHHTDALGGIVELNTGSLADPPIYMRTLQFEKSGDGRIGFKSKARPLTEGLDCKVSIPSPAKPEWDYGVDLQRTAHASLADWNWLQRGWHMLINIGKGLAEKEEEKHQELRPQLLEYADIVSQTFPAMATLHYEWPEQDGSAILDGEDLAGNATIAAKLRALSNCRETNHTKCTIPRKENLLLALEKVYREKPDILDDKKPTATSMRLCMALAAAEASPSTKGADALKKLHLRIDQPWSMQLSPRPVAP